MVIFFSIESFFFFFPEGAFHPLPDFGHKTALADLECLTLLGTANSAHQGLNFQGCDVLPHETYRVD